MGISRVICRRRTDTVYMGIKYFEINIRQYRTKSVWRLCTPSACKFFVIFHKNAREYIKYSLRFLFHLTKNLTTHLSNNLCAVLPLIVFPSKTRRCLFFSIGYIARLFRLNRIIAGFLGTDTHCLPHIIAKDLAVADIAGICCLLNSINGFLLPFF